MQYEFDQLLEAYWDGRLDDEGHRRLDELCAADPRLAARYRQERNLTGLLSQCGPNYAPDDLASSVMARLETRVRIRPVRPWYWWVMEPAFRTAFASVVLVAMGVQIGVLISNRKETQIAMAPPSPPTPTNVEFTRRLPEVPDPDSRANGGAHPSNLASRSAVKRLDNGERLQPGDARRKPAQPVETMIAMSRETKPAPPPNYQLEPFPKATALPTPAVPHTFGEFPSAGQSLAPVAPAVPTAVPAVPTPAPAIPAVQIPAESRMAKANTAPLSWTDREVAMNITLNPNDLPRLASSSDSDSAENPLPPTAHSFVPRAEAKPRRTPLTHKEVESTLFEVPGVETKDVDLGTVPGQPGKWQVRARLTPAQLRTFEGLLRKNGIEPSPAVKAGSKEEADELRKQPAKGTRNLYDITKGSQWLRPFNSNVSPVLANQPASTSATATSVGARGGNSAEQKLVVKIIIEQVDGLLSTR